MHISKKKKKQKKTKAPAKTISVEKNTEHIATLIWKTQRGKTATRGVLRKRCLEISQNS